MPALTSADSPTQNKPLEPLWEEEVFYCVPHPLVITLCSSFTYQFFAQFGASWTFSMLKGSMGQFGDFLSRCEEDVVVLAHTHSWKEQEIKSTKNGDVFYINAGTWIDYASDVSMA